jgi:hypothetical protein
LVQANTRDRPSPGRTAAVWPECSKGGAVKFICPGGWYFAAPP